MSKTYDYSCGYPIELGAGSTETNKTAWVKAKSEFERIYRLFNENLKYYDVVASGIEKLAEDLSASFEKLKTEINQAVSDAINSIDEKISTAISEATEDMLKKGDTKYITEFYKGSGCTWYRKWSNGWIEQGGMASGSGYTPGTSVSLPISFSNTNYNVVATKYNSGGSHVLNLYSKTKSTFNAGAEGQGGSGWSGSATFHFYACGY